MTESMGLFPDAAVNFRVPRLRTDRDRVELLLSISNSLLFLIENPENAKIDDLMPQGGYA